MSSDIPSKSTCAGTSVNIIQVMNTPYVFTLLLPNPPAPVRADPGTACICAVPGERIWKRHSSGPPPRKRRRSNPKDGAWPPSRLGETKDRSEESMIEHERRDKHRPVIFFSEFQGCAEALVLRSYKNQNTELKPWCTRVFSRERYVRCALAP